MGTTGSGTGSLITPVTTSLQSVVDGVRWRLNNYEQPYLWSDKELVAYTNDIVRRFLYETKMIEESTDTTICNLSLVDGTQDYTISDRIIQVRSARVSGEDSDLEIKTFMEMDEEHPTWRGDTSEGVPTIMITDWQHQYASFWPIPDTSYTCYLRVYRIQKTDFTPTGMSGQVLEIPDIFYMTIVEGVASLALLKSGPNTFDPQKAQVHEAVFQRKLHETKLHQLRLHNKVTFNKPHNGFM